ncbi:MAG: iron ABC transporter permease [Pseudomonadota bacterium]
MSGAHRTTAISGVVALCVVAPIIVLVRLGWGADLDAASEILPLVRNTLALTVLTVIGAIGLGVPLAIVTAHCDIPYRRFWLAALVAPLAVPSYIGAFTYFAAFGSGGEISNWVGWDVPKVEGLWGTALVMSLFTYPLVLLTTRASLKQLDGRMVEAARSLGATLPESLRRVVMPRVRSGIAGGALLVALYTMSDFATPSILGFDTFTRVIFVEYNAFGLDRAALLSLVLLVIIAAVLMFESRVGVEEERAQHPFSIELTGVARPALMGLMVVTLMAALVLPALVFGAWLLGDETSGVSWALVWNTLMPALLAAFGAVLLALPVASGAARGGLGRWFERLATLGYGIPGIVLGTALLYVGLRVDWLYQTLTLLVLAHILKFLPLSIGPLRDAVARSDQNLTNAARGLGATPAEAFRRVAFPMLLPAAIAGGALVFLEVMRELPLTLLLRPTGLETLTTELWQVYEAGYFGRAAVPSLLLIAISAVGVVFMLTGERGLNDVGVRS